MRKELDLERRDLFDAGDGTGAGSKRKHASSQPSVTKEAMEQVRVKYLQAVTNAQPPPPTPPMAKGNKSLRM